MKGPLSKDTILIRMPNWLGDAVMATALLEPIKDQYAHVIVMADTYVRDVLEGNPHIDELIIFRRNRVPDVARAVKTLRSRKIKAAVTLTPSLSSGLILWMAGAKIRGGFVQDGLFLNRKFRRARKHNQGHLIEEYKTLLHMIDETFDFRHVRQHIPLDDHIGEKVLKRFPMPEADGLIVLAPFAQYGQAKMWPWPYWEGLMDRMESKYGQGSICILGSRADSAHGIVKRPHVYDLRGQTSVEDAKYIIKNAALFIGNDTGLMHIADALDTPLIAIFGSTSPGWTGPLSKKATIVSSDVPCSPCFDRTCRFGHYQCLTSITPDRVYGEAKKILGTGS